MTKNYLNPLPPFLLQHKNGRGFRPRRLAAHQPSAQPRNHCRVDHNLLLLCLLDGHRLKALHEGETTKRADANAKPSHHLRLIPDPNLPHLNPHLELLG